ncbi:hypothetical protein CROQUDRAFT_506714 [Cronartium quercuum f. sp. fusiforme G11]|uniref:Protein CPL1-like domain-containing protein n=1 Tax=Cronartium quercuum f. sp. fusiforme G11 TaxID=708437 RepID=A0A9P6TGC4_9BASI|nr:hypothetical protein CROQUDRAFT_506714 [Cronartium quercuum f. sp. fusiforme G11]
MARCIALALFISILSGCVMATSYRTHFERVNIEMSELYEQIGGIQSIASQKGHTDVQSKCAQAKALLDSAQTTWQDLSITFVNKPWLASEHGSSSKFQTNLSKCGEILQEIYKHHQVESETSPYSNSVKVCQRIYTKCVASCDSIWKWQPPAPQPSGGYGAGSSSGGSGGNYGGGYTSRKVKRHHSKEMVPICPNKETACPISRFSVGFECFDTDFELTSCGGCVTMGEGENCLAITGAAGVGCLEGRCVVLSVQIGFYLGHQGRPIRRRKRT